MHLRKGDLDPKIDPMNIATFWRLFRKEVIDYLDLLVMEASVAADIARASAVGSNCRDEVCNLWEFCVTAC
jgi:hypothetical protein